MKHLTRSTIALCLAVTISMVSFSAAPSPKILDLGSVPIGGAPKTLNIFRSTDCNLRADRFGDCSGHDQLGREYMFYDGVLARVSAHSPEAKAAPLPAKLRFGCKIEDAVSKFTKIFGVHMYRGRSPMDGAVVYTSHFVVPSSKGINTSIELIADRNGSLVEVVQRTDAND